MAGGLRFIDSSRNWESEVGQGIDADTAVHPTEYVMLLHDAIESKNNLVVNLPLRANSCPAQ